MRQSAGANTHGVSSVYIGAERGKYVRQYMQLTQSILLLAVILIWVLYFLGVIQRTGLFIATGSSIVLLVISALILRHLNLSELPSHRGVYRDSINGRPSTFSDGYIEHSVNIISYIDATVIENSKFGISWHPGDVCVICLLQFEETSDVVQIACRHTFHTSCIKNWMVVQSGTRISQTCPTCRYPIFPNERSRYSLP